jgi:hypothetical protein
VLGLLGGGAGAAKTAGVLAGTALILVSATSGIGYEAWAWFWVPGNPGITDRTGNNWYKSGGKNVIWECGNTSATTIEEISWIFYESASNGIDDE